MKLICKKNSSVHEKDRVDVNKVLSITKNFTRLKNLQFPKKHLTLFQKSSFLVAIKEFNELPTDYKQLEDVDKRLLKKKLKCIYKLIENKRR